VIRVISPYRPFAPESDAHQSLGPFDWIGALEMCQASVKRNSPDTEAVAITDIDTRLPVPSLQFKTTERRLMLWILDVCLRYLESDAFDRDTVMVSPDCLVLKDLRPWFAEKDAEMGIVIRTEPKHRESGRVILNQVQFWRRSSRQKIVAFYHEALKLAKTLPEDVIVWGADTEPLRQLLEPIDAGVWDRAGLRVDLIEWHQILEGLTTEHKRCLAWGSPIRVSRSILDFRATRKLWMRQAFDSLIGVPA
jgi:hypothetical protein